MPAAASPSSGAGCLEPASQRPATKDDVPTPASTEGRPTMLGPVKRIVPAPLKRAVRTKFNVWADESPPVRDLIYRADLAQADRARLQERHDHLTWEVGQLRE